MRALSRLGKALRKHRIDHSLGTNEFARCIGTSPSYVSGVEHGVAELPVQWLPKIKKLFHLSLEQMEELRDAAQEQIKTLRVPLVSHDVATKLLLLKFVEKINELSPETKAKIMRLLHDKSAK